MKYIRTKDGIFEVYFENKKGCNVNTRHCLETRQVNIFIHNFISNENIIKQADTIEELCDEFVYKHFDSYELCDIKTFDVKTTLEYFNAEIYGAIWTNKGLIYVAKMNDKGELELL